MSSTKPIYVTRPYLPSRDRVDTYFTRVYESGMLTNNGPLVQELTSRLESYLGVKNLLLVSNGTVALLLALKLLQVKGEVVTTPFTFPATATSIAWHGATPIFADIDVETYGIDPVEIQKRITSRTTAIMPTHVFGSACDVTAIDALADNLGLPVIYDAAQSFGVNYDGASLLSHGAISTVSFHATKIFHTVEGGALIIKDPEMFAQAKKLINFGLGSSGAAETIGINAKMNEYEAAMGLAVLDDIALIRSELQSVSAHYDKLLSLNLARQKIDERCSYNYSYYPVRFPSEAQRESAVKALNSQEIYPRRYFYPSLDTLDVFGKTMDNPLSQQVASQILCLPHYVGLPLERIEHIAAVCNQIAAS